MKLSVGASEYSPYVSSRVLKPFMKYPGNKICLNEWTNKRMNKRGIWTARKHNAFIDNVGASEGMKISLILLHSEMHKSVRHPLLCKWYMMASPAKYKMTAGDKTIIRRRRYTQNTQVRTKSSTSITKALIKVKSLTAAVESGVSTPSDTAWLRLFFLEDFDFFDFFGFAKLLAASSTVSTS